MELDYCNFQRLRGLTNPKAQVDRFVESKSLADVPESVRKEVKLISLTRQDIGVPFGSYMNRVADYFGDVDIIQLADKFKTMESIGPITAKAIQQTIKRIKASKTRWFGEFKAGIDKMYFFDIGRLNNGVYTFSKELVPNSKALFSNKFITKVEYDVIMKITSKKLGDGDDYDVVFNLFRNYYVLRWTIDEVLKGVKILPGNRIYTLEQAVIDRTAVKIDMIVYLNGKYIEITNFIAIMFMKNGKLIPINVEEEELTPANLVFEVEKLYYSNYHYKPFKMTKRAFAYLKWLRKTKPSKSNDNLIRKYVGVLDQTINILYTINSELDAMRIIEKKLSKIKISKRLNELKGPLANVLEINSEMLAVINRKLDSSNPNLKELHDSFNKIIDFWTIIYFQQADINPPPVKILPKKMSYNPAIVRCVIEDTY